MFRKAFKIIICIIIAYFVILILSKIIPSVYDFLISIYSKITNTIDLIL